MIELKPCPFCGTADFLQLSDFEGDCSNCGYGAWGRRVICSAAGWYTVEAGKQHGPKRGCGASVGYRDTDEEAIEAWNRRAVDPATVSDTKTPKPDDATAHDENKDAKATGANP